MSAPAAEQAAAAGATTETLDAKPAAPAAAASSPAASSSEPPWEDITSRFESAFRSLLRPGELLHHSSFSLKESMSALELGDPKMDAAMHVPRGIMTFDKAMREGLIVPPAQLTPFQMLDIIDELFACECTSYTGSHLAYTVYTCIYLHRLSLVHSTNPLLCAYLFYFLRSLEVSRAIIINADIYTDEDFVHNLGMIKLGDMDIPANFQNGSSTATPLPPTLAELEGDKTGAEEKYKQPYAGEKATLDAAYEQQEQAIAKKIDELRAEYKGEMKEEEMLRTPATAASSELHIWLLLSNRFSFRRAWANLNLFARRPPHSLANTLERTAEFESTVRKELDVMEKTVGGTSWREEEAKRQKREDAHRALVNDLLARHTADPTFKPDFPRPPEPHLFPRELSYGFHVGMTKCLIQSSPPRQVNMLYRRDAVGLMQEYMSHFSYLHRLRAIVEKERGTFHEVVKWFEGFHALNANILLRSHVWLLVQYPDASGQASGEKAKDPMLRMMEFLWPGTSEAKNVAPPAKAASSNGSHSGALSPASIAPLLAPSSSSDSIIQLLIKSHVRLSPSAIPLAVQAWEYEQARIASGEEWRPWEPGQPFTYHAFLGRMIAPFHRYLKLLVESATQYRGKVFSTDMHASTNLILDWNVLHDDASALDGKDFVDLGLRVEEERVEVNDPAMVGNHPCLLYHYNCHNLVQETVLQFMSSYLFLGLEQNLYTPRELPIVLWMLENALDQQVQIVKRRARLKGELVVLAPPLPMPPGSGAQAKKKSGVKLASKTAAAAAVVRPRHQVPPMQSLPPRPDVVGFRYKLMEAQHMCARALVQLMEGLKAHTITVGESKADGAAAADEKTTAAAAVPASAVPTEEQKDDGPAAPSSSSSSTTSTQQPAVLLPTLDPTFESIWFSHRFSAFTAIKWPPAQPLTAYVAMRKQFAALSAERILSIANLSFTRTKEALSLIAKEFIQGTGETQPKNILSVHEVEYVKNLQRVVVSNLMLCSLTFPKQLAEAQSRGRPLTAEFRFEPQTASPFQTLQTTRFGHFPIIVLKA